MSFAWELLTGAGAATALVGGAAYLSKALVNHRLTKDLEDHKRALLSDLETHKAALALANTQALDRARFEFEQQLIERRGAVDILKEGFKFGAESDKQRAERLRTQVQRWAVPIRSAIADLSGRLDNILQHGGHVLLQPGPPPVPGWSADHAYFMPSTLYYAAQYFCWTRLLEQQLGHELFRSGDEMARFFDLMHRCTDTLGRYPFDTEVSSTPPATDRQVFKLQQRAVGELLLEHGSSGDGIASYRAFLDRWTDADDRVFHRHIAPLETFLRGLQPQADVRWLRLRALRTCLADFDRACAHVRQPATQGDVG